MDEQRRKILWIWETGSNAATGPLNIDDADSRTSALQLQDLQVRKFTLGKSCAAIISEDDKLYLVGQPGGSVLSLSGIQTTLREISILKSHEVKHVDCGYHHVVALVQTGIAFCWGASSAGQCGIVKDLVEIPNRVEIVDKKKVVLLKTVACGKHHTMAISDEMELWGWGASHLISSSNTPYQNLPCPRPELIQHLCGRRILQVSCGKSHTVVLSEKIQQAPSDIAKPDVVERCDICNQDIYKWGDKELIMQDKGDQVIITDTHICAQQQMQSSIVGTSSSSDIAKVKSSHVRSLSLPFLRKHSPLSVTSNQAGLSKTPPSVRLEHHSDLLFSDHKVASDTNLSIRSSKQDDSPTSIELMAMPKSDNASVSSTNDLDLKDMQFDKDLLEKDKDVQNSDENVSTEKYENVQTVDTVAATRKIISKNLSVANLQISKSASMPADLWKKAQTESDRLFSFGAKVFPDDSSSISCSPPGSSSTSLASADEYKSRMTLPLPTDGEMSIDPESALDYLNRLSPDLVENQEYESEVPKAAQGFVFMSEETAQPEIIEDEKDEMLAMSSKRTISERITKSITDNQLLSPLTSYSKNVFTGVMDQIEWIKTSTYDKGVAPIRDLWSKAEKKELPENGVQDTSEEDEVFRFTNSQSTSTSYYDPLRVELPLKTEEGNLAPDEHVTLDTEVWSWGENRHGELGFSDQLDRFQPACLKGLSHRSVVKVCCGSHHTVVLTSNGEMFTWGSNAHGQLGHQESSTRYPNKVERKNRIWDIAAGRHHTLILVDGAGQKPNVMVCGSDIHQRGHSADPLRNANKVNKNSKDWKLRLVELSHKMGYRSSVISGFSPFSCCLAEENCSGFTATLHEFAKFEREFYQQIISIKTEFLQPFMFSDLYKLFENSTYCELLSENLEAFEGLVQNVGLNVIRLTRAVVDGTDLTTDVFTHAGDKLMKSFERYFETLNNMVAYGFFEKCEIYSTKRSKFLLQERILNLFKKLLTERKMAKIASENFLQILQLPLLRLREYANSLNKVAVSSEENVAVGIYLEEISVQWDTLWTKINVQSRSAHNTRIFWKNEFKASSGLRLAESLKKPGRYLVMHGRKERLDIAHSGRFSFNWFILFTDCLALVHYGTHVVYPLEILWCSPIIEGKDKSRGIRIVSPEDEIVAIAGSEQSKSIWMNAFNRAINLIVGKDKETDKECPQNLTLHRTPSLGRNAGYTFAKHLELKGARYVGAWLNGKPHGRGKMTWGDGRCYKGNYKNGLENGFGEWKAASGDATKLKYQGWWKDGKMDGSGKIWYSKYQTYEGRFVAGAREGHGILRTGSVTEGSVYVGEWKKDHRNGFGVEDNITDGEKYLGMWLNDQRHGVGIVVTLDGLYGQSRFFHGEMNGDALLIEGRYVFEGHVAAGMMLNGKGRLTLPTGDKIEGSFSGPWGENLRISGNLIRGDPSRANHAKPESPRSPLDTGPTFPSHHHQKDHTHGIIRRYNRHLMKKLVEGKKSRSFPLMLHPDLKWTDIFLQCRKSLNCVAENGEKTSTTKEVWEAVSVAITNARHRKEILQHVKTTPRKKVNERKLSWLEHVPSVVRMENDEDAETYLSRSVVRTIQEYVQQAFSTTLHPLGELAESMGNVFRDSYSGAGAHKWLLTQAVADVRSFVRRSYDILRCMFPQLDKEQGNSQMKVFDHQIPHEHERASSSSFSEEAFCQITAGDLLLPIILPRVYPTLFTLYALRHEIEDHTYWERVTRLNRHPDIALLSFLGVKSKFWLLDEKEIPPLETDPGDGQLYESEEQAESSKWRHLLVARARDCSFLNAIETLQLISTTFIPAEKLNVIHSTFKEINSTVMKHHRTKHTWSMDDLFPVFQYVVIRSRISHLGCEIQLVEDFLEPEMCKGEKGIMFTTLKACYFQIRVEKDL